MVKRAGVVLFAAGVVGLAGCGKAPAPAPTVNEAMTHVMSPQAQTVWDITSRAFNANGDALVPSLITSADWAALKQSGQQIKDTALLLANASHVVAAAPGAAVMGAFAAPRGPVKKTWDAASVQQIQAMIDANPALFAQRAKILADAGDTVVRASNAKDAATLYQVSAGLDEVCDGCHQKFWGTDDPPPVKP
jgi:hypothetical protein